MKRRLRQGQHPCKVCKRCGKLGMADKFTIAGDGTELCAKCYEKDTGLERKAMLERSFARIARGSVVLSTSHLIPE